MMDKSKNKNFVSAASRLSAIASSVMDLHVRIALQEVDREKRRLISGGVFIAIGAILLLIILIDLLLAGLSLKLGGKLIKGPYLPQTLEGLGKTTKAVLGKK